MKQNQPNWMILLISPLVKSPILIYLVHLVLGPLGEDNIFRSGLLHMNEMKVHLHEVHLHYAELHLEPSLHYKLKALLHGVHLYYAELLLEPSLHFIFRCH